EIPVEGGSRRDRMAEMIADELVRRIRLLEPHLLFVGRQIDGRAQHPKPIGMDLAKERTKVLLCWKRHGPPLLPIPRDPRLGRRAGREPRVNPRITTGTVQALSEAVSDCLY